MVMESTSQKKEIKLLFITQELFLMEKNSILQETETNHLNSIWVSGK